MSSASAVLPVVAPAPARGGCAQGFEPVARCFASQLAEGAELGAGLAVYHRGTCVVDLWGGLADVGRGTPWQRDTRLVIFSATKGLAAMGFHLLAARGRLDWDAEVRHYWPGFGAAGKDGLTVRTLLNHRGGLAALDTRLSLDQCLDDAGRDRVVAALEGLRPSWEPDTQQGYHAITFGMYAGELFRRITGEPLGEFLHRELLVPLESDARMGTPASEDAKVATLYPPPTGARLARMVASLVIGDSPEARLTREALRPRSLARRAFLNPSSGRGGLSAYNQVPVRRAALAWASATASAHGLARAYLPFAAGGSAAGRSFFPAASLEPLQRRQSWSTCDLVLQKPLGWSQGFVKEELHLFSPVRESFGHPGMGGALGWCDPVNQLCIGYVPNRMDWRLRSPRAVALCRALYECEPLLAPP
jgi:CubicO group peptidase (beta-lactamase class C family)